MNDVFQEDISIKIKWVFLDYLKMKLQFFFQSKTNLFSMFIIFVAIFVGIATGLGTKYFSNPYILMLCLVISVVLAFLIQYFFTIAIISYDYFQNRNSSESIKLTKNKLVLSNSEIDHSVEWGNLTAFEETRKFIFVFSKNLKEPLLMIPKQSFINSSEESKFVAYCKSGGVVR